MADHPEPDDKPPGDQINTQIGENARNVAAGKNIFQFIGNTLNLPTYLVVVLICALGVLAGAGLMNLYLNRQVATNTASIHQSPDPCNALSSGDTPIGKSHA